MYRTLRQWPVWFLLLFFLGAVTTGCISSSSSDYATGAARGGTGANANAAPQLTFAQALRLDAKSADRGVLAYRPLGTIKAGKTKEFFVSVTDVGRYMPVTGNQEVAARQTLSGFIIDPNNVPTGGLVGVQIGCANLSCRSSTPARQAVVQRNHPVYWSWEITGESAGPALITLTEDLYMGGTSTVLKGVGPVQIKLKVLPSPHPKKASGFHVVTVIYIAAAIATIAAAIVAIWDFNRRRKKTEPTERAPSNT